MGGSLGVGAEDEEEESSKSFNRHAHAFEYDKYINEFVNQHTFSAYVKLLSAYSSNTHRANHHAVAFLMQVR